MSVNRGKGGGKYTSGMILSSTSAASGCFLTAESMTFCLCSIPAFGNCSSPGGK